MVFDPTRRPFSTEPAARGQTIVTPGSAVRDASGMANRRMPPGLAKRPAMPPGLAGRATMPSGIANRPAMPGRPAPAPAVAPVAGPREPPSMSAPTPAPDPMAVANAMVKRPNLPKLF